MDQIANRPIQVKVAGGDVLRKLVELDSLRALMALWVYISHVMFITALRDPLHILHNGGPAVTVFIMISGFAIATSLIHSRASYPAYMARRIARIYPIYLVGLVLGLATSHLYPSILTQAGWTNPKDITRLAARVVSEQEHFWSHLAAHLSMVHGAIPDKLLNGTALAFNGPAWSLSLEMQFYVVAPLMVAILARPKKHWIGLAGLAAACVLGLYANRFYPVVPSFLPQMLAFFIVGILTALHLDYLRKRPIVLAAGLVFGVAAIVIGRSQVGLPILLWSGVIAVCCLRGNRVAAAARGIMAWRPLVDAGEASYGFYILHMPILILWAGWLVDHGFAADQWIFAGMLALSLPVIASIAWLSFRYFEKPITKWARRRFGGAAIKRET